MPDRKLKTVWEFGDFQTPEMLADSVCQLLMRNGITPASIIEPSCGQGSFLASATTIFPTSHLIGVDINRKHLAEASQLLSSEISTGQVELQHGDFFKVDWNGVLHGCSDPCLILGNPPWVTSAELSALASENVPVKSNFYGRSGIEALTGKSNFDISEWMLLRYLDWLKSRRGWIAVLVKTVVARKILAHAWKVGYPIKAASLYSIDAMQNFNAAVDACLFVLAIEPDAQSQNCDVFISLHASSPAHTIGVQDGFLVADIDAYLRWHHLAGGDQRYVWRSGIKHDCSKVMELRREGDNYWNGLDEVVSIEDHHLYPMLKSSDVNKNVTSHKRFMLVTQKSPSDDTASIRITAPKTWAYLQSHASLLENRRSNIYRNRPRFAMFGIGNYSFAPWKVAISGFYKNLNFVPVGGLDGRPRVFDDTVYFLPCQSAHEAEFLSHVLNSDAANQFLRSMIFWADKRPITIDLLKRLNIAALAEELGYGKEYASFGRLYEHQASDSAQLRLLE